MYSGWCIASTNDLTECFFKVEGSFGLGEEIGVGGKFFIDFQGNTLSLV
jgi:hypothetical protein